MSGALARALGTVSAVGNAFSLITGASPVTLADIAFTSFEVPERVQWGGQQAMTVHRFPGGARVIDAMGPDEAEIAWSGLLLGGNAPDRAAQLDALRVFGQPVTLVWGDFGRTVVVASCSFDHGFQRIGYQISCTVVPDDQSGVGGIAPSPLDAIKGDLSSAIGFDLTGALAPVAAGIQAAQAVAAPLAGVVSSVAAVGLGSSISGALGTVGSVLTQADVGMSAAADALNIVGSVGGLAGALESNRLAANGLSARGYAGRALLNVGG